MDVIQFVRSWSATDGDGVHIRIGLSGKSKDPALCGAMPRYRPEFSQRDAWEVRTNPFVETLCQECAQRLYGALQP